MKILTTLCFLLFSGFIYSNDIEIKLEEQNKIYSEEKITSENFDPLSCCTRRRSSGTYGQPDYNQVIVTRCSTSTTSYQDANARACVLAEASADKVLEMSQNTALPVTVGGQ